MSDFETPFFRDLSKLLLPICLGVILAFATLVLWYPIAGEIWFNIDGAEEGYNIFNDRKGSCFETENKSMCSSGAWPVSIFLVIPLPILIGICVWLFFYNKKINKEIDDITKKNYNLYKEVFDKINEVDEDDKK